MPHFARLRLLAVTFAFVGIGAGFGQPAPEKKPKIFVCGDSTARNTTTGKNGQPCVGWGTPLADYFDPEKVTVINVAHAGQSSRTYYNNAGARFPRQAEFACISSRRGKTPASDRLLRCSCSTSRVSLKSPAISCGEHLCRSPASSPLRRPPPLG